MTRTQDREKARKLRRQRKSYSEIKEVLGISKSTLSGWLRDMPLSAEEIRQLRAASPRRIERFRETMKRKRDSLLNNSYEEARKDISKLSKRDLFIAGLYLYWGEGTKSAPGKVSIANTDPKLVKAFLDWLLMMKVPRARLRVRLHVYADMRIEEETNFWAAALNLPASQFRKPHVKLSVRSAQTYKGAHGHGTCDLSFENIILWRYITMALKYLREQHFRP